MALKWIADRTKVSPVLADDIDGLFAPIPGDWAITCGKRLASEQAALYAQGRTAPGDIVTNSPPGHSAHEAGPDTDTPAQAVDFCELVDGAQSWVENERWVSIWAACKAHPRLHSGHDFPPIAKADDDHIESYAWAYGDPSIRDQLKAAGQW